VLALYLIYLFVGKLVAQDLVNFTETDAWSWTLGTVDSGESSTSMFHRLPGSESSSWASSGVVSMTVTYLIFLLLPLVIAFYFSLALMETAGICHALQRLWIEASMRSA